MSDTKDHSEDGGHPRPGDDGENAGGPNRGAPATAPATHAPATRVVHAGRRPEWTRGLVSPPVGHASTCLFPTLADLDAAIRDPDAGLYYGRRGTPTQWSLEAALTELEPGAAGTKLFPSGVAAIAAALFAVLQAGDHLLVPDCVYDPTRSLCDDLLDRLGVETTYYDPLIGAGIDALMRPTTRAIFLESPGSLTFEVQDVPAIVAVARAHGALTLIDNTWATPLLLPAIALGVDMSVQSLTKYIGGHSDLMMGSVTAAPSAWGKLQRAAIRLGQVAAPDDAFLAARGLRTLPVRLARQGESGLAIARWLAEHPKVDRVLHPALPSCPGHDAFARDFLGTAGLFGFTLKAGGRADMAPFVDGLAHFGMGFSWGGFESLILPVEPQRFRTVTRWQAPGQLLRLSIGLEDPHDLIDDLDAGLARLTG